MIENVKTHETLRPGWVWANIGDICEPVNGKAFKSSEWRDSGLPIIRIKNLKDPVCPFNYYQGNLQDKFKVKHKDLLFAWSGTPGTSFGAHIWQGKDAALNQHIFNINYPEKLINKSYFCHALNHNVARYIEQAQGGVGLAHITKTKFVKSKIPLPPLPEQHRIVSKIEELFTKLDAGVEAIKKAKAQLNLYRQAVLKSAFEGKLTEEWRSSQKGIEPYSNFIGKISKEKKRYYETELKRSIRVGGKKPKKPPPSILIDQAKLHQLPKGWGWVSVSDIALKIQYGYTASSSNDCIGPKMLRITDIQNGKVDWHKVPYCRIDESLVDNYRLRNYDIVFARTGATVGKSFLIAGNVPDAVFASYLIRIVPSNLFPPKFLYYFFQSGFYWKQITEEQAGIGQPNVNGTKLSRIIFPFPNISEQALIVDKLDSIFSMIDITERAIEKQLKHIEAVRFSILKKAFKGQLVLQDSSDEPASKLLKRIKTEKEEAKQKKKTKKPKRTSRN